MAIKILVVDDATFIRDLIKRTIKKFIPKCDLFDAADGKKAQSLLNRQPIDLILSDWEMPGLSGEELLAWVREHDIHRDVPFVMISSLGGKENILKASQAGVSDYLGKPFTNEELMLKVQKTLLKSGKITKPFLSAPSGVGGFASAEVLTGKKSPASNTGNSQVSGNTAVKATKAKPQMKGTALLKYRQGEMKCMIKTISDENMSVISRRPQDYPKVLEKIVVDICPTEMGKTSVSALDSYVRGISAVEKSVDAEFLSFDIYFIDEDLSKVQQLSIFLDEIGEFGHT